MATNNIFNNSTNFIDGFCALKSATTNNVTGDGTEYTVIFDSEVYDRGNVYNNSTGIFTAPRDGFYYLQAQVLVSDIDSGSLTGNIYIKTTPKNIRFAQANPYVCKSGTGSFSMHGSAAMYLTAGDMAYVTITLDSGLKTTDVVGASSLYTFFSGIRIG